MKALLAKILARYSGLLPRRVQFRSGSLYRLRFSTMPGRNPHSQEDSELISDLHALSKKNPKLVKSVTYDAPADPSIQVSSWRMNEFKYYQIPSPFPTLARGIFTVQDEENTTKDGKQGYRIVARGYDKFFNIGEVPWTTVGCLSFVHSRFGLLMMFAVGCAREPHRSTVHSYAQVKWVYHLHCTPHFLEACDHLEAFSRGGRRRPSKPRTGRRGLGEEVPEEQEQNRS